MPSRIFYLVRQTPSPPYKPRRGSRLGDTFREAPCPGTSSLRLPSCYPRSACFWSEADGSISQVTGLCQRYRYTLAPAGSELASPGGIFRSSEAPCLFPATELGRRESGISHASQPQAALMHGLPSEASPPARGLRDGFALGRGAMCPKVGVERTRQIHPLAKGLSRCLGHADRGRTDTHIPAAGQVFYEDNTQRISPAGRACGAGRRPLSESRAQIW